jgi:hypothetical protein
MPPKRNITALPVDGYDHAFANQLHLELRWANAIEAFHNRTFTPAQIGEQLTNRQVKRIARDLDLEHQSWIMILTYFDGSTIQIPLYYNSHAELILRSVLGKAWSQGFTQNELPDAVKDSEHWDFDNGNRNLGVLSIGFKVYRSSNSNRGRNNAAFYAHRHLCSELSSILDKHQIFFQGSERPEREEHCLINSLRNAGIEEERIAACKEHLRGSSCYLKITQKQIETTEQLIGRRINLITAQNRSNGTIKRKNKGKVNSEEKCIELVLLDNHLMYNEKLPQVSNNYLANRDQIIKQKGLKDPNLLRYRLDNHYKVNLDNRSSHMDIYRLVSQLLRNGWIDRDQKDECPVFQKLDPKTIVLTEENIESSYDPKQVKKYEQSEDEKEEKEEKDEKKKTPVKEKYFAADFESFVNSGRHRVCLAAITPLVKLEELESNQENHYIKTRMSHFDKMREGYTLFTPDDEHSEDQSENIICKFLDFLSSQIKFKKVNGKLVQTVLPVCFFHNLKYDLSVLLEDCKYPIKNLVRRSGAVYSAHIFSTHKKSKTLYFELRDSAKLFGPMQLKEVPEKFQLPDGLNKKDSVNYQYYNRGSRNVIITAEQYAVGKSFASESDRIAFVQQVLRNLKDTISQCKPGQCFECSCDCNCYCKCKGINLSECKCYEGCSCYTQCKCSARCTCNFDNYCEFNEEKGTFNPWRYYEYYLNFDVLVLGAGLAIFQRDLFALTEIDPLLSLSISSFASKTCKQNGAFDNVIPIKGVLRKFLQQSVYGGRVWVNKEYEGKMIEGRFQYLDGVSLYPSAMVELSRQIGLPTGKAKLLLPGEDPFQYPHFTVEIKITAARRSQKTGVNFIAKRPRKTSEECEELEEEGEEAESLQYVGEFDTSRGDEPIICVVDRITLEDYIEFHQIEYTVLQGVYWDGEPNRNWGNVIQGWFDLRLRHKQKGNKGMQELLKLGMNSAYGRTILRSVDEKNVYKTQDNYRNYLEENFVTIKQFQNVGKESVEFALEQTDESSNLVQAGSLVLSMSKRIMNRVMGCLSDLNSPIYYTDTDSMCINDSIIPQLEALYNDRYPGTPLIGEALGQFHSDFSVKGCDSKDIFSKRAYFIGKKMYLHVLEAKDKKGNTLEWLKMSFKGVTQASLQHLSKEHSETKTRIGDQSVYLRGLERIYQKMIDGQALRALQNPPGERSELFQYSKGGIGIQTTSKPFYKSIGSKRAVKELNLELKHIRKAVTQVIGSNKKQRID